jgi:MFS superfamily sulfate permease-like transporter
MSQLLFRSLHGLSRHNLNRDLVAGLALAAVAIPEQMATARLGHFPPQVGFYAFLAGSLAFAAFGASRLLSVGADSTITPIFAGSLALIGVGSASDAASAAILAFLVGAILIGGGLLRLGWIADLLSKPVVTGFLAGISLHIVLSQAPALLGVPGAEGNVYQRVAALATQLGNTNPITLGIGAGVLAVILLCERFAPRIPGALIALAAASAAVLAFGLENHGVSVLGGVPGGLPRLAVPVVDLVRIYGLIPISIVVALVIMMQTAATTRSFPSGDERADVDRDFIGVGAGNVLAGLTGAFPVNSSPPRTALLAESGARSQLAGLVAVAIVLVLAGLGTGLLAGVPDSALAGMLLFIAQRIFRLEIFVDTFRRARGEFALVIATMTAIVLLPIEIGVTIGIFLSLSHGVFIITRARPIEFARVPGTTVWWPAGSAESEKEPGVLVMGFQAPLSFLNAEDFRRGILDALAQKQGSVRLVVLEASSIAAIDYTAAEVLTEVIRKCRGSGMDFAVARLESVRAQAAFRDFGLTNLVGADHMFLSVAEAIRTLPGQRASQ